MFVAEEKQIEAVRSVCLYEPRHEKTGFWGFQPGLTQTGLYSHRKRLAAQALIIGAATAQLIFFFVSLKQKSNFLLMRLIFGSHHEKTCFLHVQKQRHRSAVG